MASKNVVVLTAENFDKTILSGEVVLVDFWAAWCGPCKMLAPTIDKLADESIGKAIIAKVNVDEATEIAARYKIMSIPTILVFKNGEIVAKQVGGVPLEALEDMLNRAIG